MGPFAAVKSMELAERRVMVLEKYANVSFHPPGKLLGDIACRRTQRVCRSQFDSVVQCGDTH